MKVFYYFFNIDRVAKSNILLKKHATNMHTNITFLSIKNL